MNGLETLLAVLAAYSLRDGILFAWLIHRLLGNTGTPVVPVAPVPVSGQPAPLPVPAPIPLPDSTPAASIAAKPRFVGIDATSFAGADDSVSSRTGAYDGKLIIGDTEIAAALPGPARGRSVRVWLQRTGKSADAPVRDKGPWNTTDAYWVTNTRPQAETCFLNKRKLTAGPNRGKIPTNPAGIDLSPALWNALGVANGRAAQEKVDWDFIDALEAPAPVTTADPPWLAYAEADIGFHEIGDNGGIGAFVNQAGFGAEGQPWCAIWLGAKFRQAGIDITGVNAMARSFASAPSFVKIDTPRKGCVAVFSRGAPDQGLGHCGLWMAGDSVTIQVLGGNENDQVQTEPMPVNGSSIKLLGYYWPKNQPASEPKVT